MSDTKLKPCPFCRSKNVEIFEPVNSVHIKPLQGGKIGRAIICNDCDVRISFPQAYDDIHAAAFWNGRKIEAEPERHGKWEYNNEDDPVCSVCGETDELSRHDYYYRGKIRDSDSRYCPWCGAKMDGGDKHDD